MVSLTVKIFSGQPLFGSEFRTLDFLQSTNKNLLFNSPSENQLKRMKPRELLNSIPAPTNVGRVPKGVLKQEGQWWITTATVNDTSGHIYLAQASF